MHRAKRKTGARRSSARFAGKSVRRLALLKYISVSVNYFGFSCLLSVPVSFLARFLSSYSVFFLPGVQVTFFVEEAASKQYTVSRKDRLIDRQSVACVAGGFVGVNARARGQRAASREDLGPRPLAASLLTRVLAGQSGICLSPRFSMGLLLSILL